MCCTPPPQAVFTNDQRLSTIWSPTSLWLETRSNTSWNALPIFSSSHISIKTAGFWRLLKTGRFDENYLTDTIYQSAATLHLYLAATVPQRCRVYISYHVGLASLYFGFEGGRSNFCEFWGSRTVHWQELFVGVYLYSATLCNISMRFTSIFPSYRTCSFQYQLNSLGSIQPWCHHGAGDYSYTQAITVQPGTHSLLVRECTYRWSVLPKDTAPHCDSWDLYPRPFSPKSQAIDHLWSEF